MRDQLETSTPTDGMATCDGAALTPLLGSCIRGYWASAIPFGFLILVPPLRVLAKHLRPKSYLTLEEAEALLPAEDDVGEDAAAAPLWRTLVLSAVSLLQCSAWIAAATYTVAVSPADIWNGVSHFLMATTWLYAGLRPIVKPLISFPYDLLVLFCLHLTCSTAVFVGYLYDSYVLAVSLEPLTVATNALNIVAVTGVLAVVMNMPLAVPSKRIRKEDIVGLSCTVSHLLSLPLHSRGKQSLPNTTLLRGAGHLSAGCSLCSSAVCPRR